MYNDDLVCMKKDKKILESVMLQSNCTTNRKILDYIYRST